MGAKVQNIMYLSGNYPMMELNDNASNGSWLTHGKKTMGQYYDIFSARPAINGFQGYEMEQLRQTILKHEALFRQQLKELHRLYKIQTDMMNEVRNKELHQHPKPFGASQSRFFAFPSVDNQSRCHDSGRSLVDFGHQMSSASGCGSNHNGSKFKEFESLESKCKIQRRLFDLERPADECINDEDEYRGTPRFSGVENSPSNGNFQYAAEKNGYLSTHGAGYSNCNGDASSSNMNLRRNLGLTDLNEPVQVEEASSTASVDVLGNVREGIHKRDLSAGSCSGILAKEASQSPTKEKDEEFSLHNLHNVENEKRQKEWLHALSPGQNTSNKSSQSGGFHGEYLTAMCKSSQVRSQRTDQLKREQSSKRTLFGVEISQTNQDSCVLDSDNNACRAVHGHKVAWDKPLINDSIRSVPSFKADKSYQNGHSVVSQIESKESKAFHGSVGFGCLNGVGGCKSKQISQHGTASNLRSLGWLGNSKSVDEEAVLLKRHGTEAMSILKAINVDDLKNEENSKDGLSWLRNSSFCNGKYSRDRDGSHHVNSNLLENQFHQFAVKAERMKAPSQSFISSLMANSHPPDAEDRKNESGSFSNRRKILGVPIFDKQMSKDLPSERSATKLNCALEINGVTSNKGGLLLADLNHDPMPSDSGETQYLKVVDAKERSYDRSTNLGDGFDLNVSMSEEESQLTIFSSQSKVKTVLDIDLEAPVVIDSEVDMTFGGEFAQRELIEPSSENSGECCHEDSMKDAAEALISFLSSEPSSHLKSSASDALEWFAEVITSYETEMENEISNSAGTDSTECEDFTPTGIDYFEFMTLNLTEIQIETCHYEPEVLENTIEEVTLARRPRRGQARRGRQRKDFQRDVLPGLVSLSKHDVTDDLQIIEGLVKATGGTWQSSLTQRNLLKGRAGRGRKRIAPATIAPEENGTSPTEIVVGPSPTQQQKSGETGLEETRLTGWGKRTRRPPRQRCPSNHAAFQLQ